jgi:hypothetical protein
VYLVDTDVISEARKGDKANAVSEHSTPVDSGPGTPAASRSSDHTHANLI